MENNTAFQTKTSFRDVCQDKVKKDQLKADPLWSDHSKHNKTRWKDLRDDIRIYFILGQHCAPPPMARLTVQTMSNPWTWKRQALLSGIDEIYMILVLFWTGMLLIWWQSDKNI